MHLSRRNFIKYAISLAATATAAFYVFNQYYKKNEKRVLRIGYQPSTHQLAHMTAMEKGWWAQDLKNYGVDEIVEYEFPSGPPEMQAMLAGDLDVAYVGATPPIVAIDTGLDAKIVANVQIQGSHLTLTPQNSYKDPASLKELKIGTFPPGSIQNTVFSKWFLDNSLNPEKEVELVSMGPGDAVTSMAARAIDGCFLPHPYPAVIELEGNGKMVLGSGEMWPNHTCCCLLLSGELLRNHRELAKQVIRTHIKATEYNIQNIEEAAEIYSRKVGWNADDVFYSFQTWDGRWVYDPHLGQEVTLEYAKVLYELGMVSKKLDKEQLFDTSLYDELGSASSL
ncbi:ABC transporter substrate-binding protein [[Eubacterium] cellulosolvens]